MKGRAKIERGGSVHVGHITCGEILRFALGTSALTLTLGKDEDVVAIEANEIELVTYEHRTHAYSPLD